MSPRRWPALLSPVLRFVGADPYGRDVHVGLATLRNLPASLGVSVADADQEDELQAAA